MSTPCITSFGMMRKVQGLPGSVILMDDEPALSSGTLACSMTGMIASVASEHSSPSTMWGLYWSRSRLAACVAGSGLQAEVLVLDLELVAVDAGLVDLLERELDPLLVLHAEIGARTGHRQQAPILMTLSCAWAAVPAASRIASAEQNAAECFMVFSP